MSKYMYSHRGITGTQILSDSKSGMGGMSSQGKIWAFLFHEAELRCSLPVNQFSPELPMAKGHHNTRQGDPKETRGVARVGRQG